MNANLHACNTTYWHNGERAPPPQTVYCTMNVAVAGERSRRPSIKSVPNRNDPSISRIRIQHSARTYNCMPYRAKHCMLRTGSATTNCTSRQRIRPLHDRGQRDLPSISKVCPIVITSSSHAYEFISAPNVNKPHRKTSTDQASVRESQSPKEIIRVAT